MEKMVVEIEMEMREEIQDWNYAVVVSVDLDHIDLLSIYCVH